MISTQYVDDFSTTCRYSGLALFVKHARWLLFRPYLMALDADAYKLNHFVHSFYTVVLHSIGSLNCDIKL
jgi:hypothetical protein